MNMQNPPPFVLTEAVHTTAEAPPGMPIIPAITTAIPGGGMFNSPNATRANAHEFNAHTLQISGEFRTRTEQLPGLIEQELAATRLEGTTHALPPAEAIIRELGARQLLISRKTAEFQQKTALANQFFGEDPLSKNFHDYHVKVSRNRRDYLLGIVNAWVVSYRAAHEAKLLAQSIQMLNQQQVEVHKWLATVQAQAQAAADAQRVAAEQAWIAQEQQRQREFAEAARREQEQIRLAELAESQHLAKEHARISSEQQLKELIDAAQREHGHYLARKKARIAALAKSRRAAAEQARLAADAAAKQVAAERARLEAKAEALRRTEAARVLNEKAHRSQKEQQWRLRERALRAEEALYRAQAEKARRERILQAVLEAQEKNRQQALLDAQAKPARHLEDARLRAQWQAQTEARWKNPTFANVGSTAAFGPTFAGTLGALGSNPTTALALNTALRSAVSIAVAAISTAAAPALVGFAALLVPSELGNGDLYSASVPLSDLVPALDADLYEVAAAGAEVDLPIRLGSRAVGNRVEIAVVTTDGVTVPSNVPVRLAHFDARKNVYVSTATDAGSRGPVVTWTPLVEPQNPSTDFPLVDTELPIYEGAEVTPESGRIDPHPQLDLYGFGGWITVFPIESGIPPVFTMFRDRRQDPGIASGMGQPVSGNWLGAAATAEGAPIPEQIADKLRGRDFSSFKAFRRAFWKAVASDEDLFELFNRVDQTSLRRGLSPKPHQSEHVGQRRKYELHHVEPIELGGAVYEMDNLKILTPKRHIKIHHPKKAQGNE
jgi:hypothetical protein